MAVEHVGMEHGSGQSVKEEFTPRPEAKAVPWWNLLESTREATWKILHWLRSALDASATPKRDEQLATSLLLSGERGSGKTTVLLTAAEALHGDSNFFKKPNSVGWRPGSKEEARIERRAHEMEALVKWLEPRVEWLPTLDVEPLPVGANLLATVLVRIRNALDRGRDGGGGQRVTASILEEGVENPWGKIDQLVRDASFMWEDIAADDTRKRTEQQIRAAGIYADFETAFQKAMASVVSTLSLWQFGHTGGTRQGSGGNNVILVLPIDNVDRSIQHLHRIMKLTRLLSCPQLWFVLAAGRGDFQLFLERSFQRELTEGGNAEPEPTSEDETMAIARRQAAAAMRRSIPPAHRIKLRPVTPEEAWKFMPVDLARSWEKEDSLGSLLGQIRLMAPSSEKRQVQGEGFATLADLMNLRGHLDGELIDELATFDERLYRETKAASGDGADLEAPAPVFSDAGRLALTLPARNLVDLWQGLRHEVARGQDPDNPDEPGEAAIRVARFMLLSAIDESELPGWASRQLLHRMLRRNAQGHHILDLTGRPLRRLKMTTLSDVVQWWHAPETSSKSRPVVVDVDTEVLLRTELHLRQHHEMVLELHDLAQPGRSIPLPPNVTGWLMLLHDLLLLATDRRESRMKGRGTRTKGREPRVMNLETSPRQMTPELVVTLHEGLLADPNLVALECWWIPPLWNTFVDFSLFNTQWTAFLGMTRALLRHSEVSTLIWGERRRAKRLYRLVLAAWIDNICSVCGPSHGHWRWTRAKHGNEAAALPLSVVVPSDQGAEARWEPDVALDRYEKWVCWQVIHLYRYLLHSGRRHGRRSIARDWVERSLPLLLLPEFVMVSHFAKPLGLLLKQASKDAHLLSEKTNDDPEVALPPKVVRDSQFVRQMLEPVLEALLEEEPLSQDADAARREDELLERRRQYLIAAAKLWNRLDETKYLIRRRRYEMVREIVQRSEAYQALKSETGDRAAWVLKVCERWFRAVDPPDKERPELLRQFTFEPAGGAGSAPRGPDPTHPPTAGEHPS